MYDNSHVKSLRPHQMVLAAILSSLSDGDWNFDEVSQGIACHIESPRQCAQTAADIVYDLTNDIRHLKGVVADKDKTIAEQIERSEDLFASINSHVVQVEELNQQLNLAGEMADRNTSVIQNLSARTVEYDKTVARMADEISELKQQLELEQTGNRALNKLVEQARVDYEDLAKAKNREKNTAEEYARYYQYLFNRIITTKTGMMFAREIGYLASDPSVNISMLTAIKNGDRDTAIELIDNYVGLPHEMSMLIVDDMDHSDREKVIIPRASKLKK